MAAQGNYAASPKNGLAVLSTANSNRDGTGTIATVMTGATRATGADPAKTGGSRIDALSVCATGTTTAGMVRLFIHDGTNARLYAEIPVSPVTPGANTPAWAVRLNRDNSDIMPIVLQDGYSLRAATEKAETFHVAVIQGGDF